MPATIPARATGVPAARPRPVLALRVTAVLLVAWAAAGIARLATPAGVRAEYFAAPDWSGSPARVAIDAEPSEPGMLRAWRYSVPRTFSVQWFGWVYVDRPGDYTFAVAALGRAQLQIDTRLLVASERDGVNTGTLRLSRGAHAMLVRYAQPRGDPHFALSWSRDGGPTTPVPAWRLSARRVGYATLIAMRLGNAAWLPLTLALIACAAVTTVRLRRPREQLEAATSALPRPGARRAAVLLALFVVLAIVHTWPLATAPGRLSRDDNADTQLNEWALAWIAHEAPRHPLALFDGNIFHPERHALAFSEALLAQGAMAAPILWLGGSPVLAYNVVLMAGFALTGWAMCLVVATWTDSWIAGIAAGAIVAFNAHTLTRLPHIQAQHAEFLPLALLALDALLRRPRWRTALWLGVCTALQGYASIYLLVFTIVALGAGVAVRPEDWAGDRLRTTIPMLAGAALIAAAALLPLLAPYWQLHQAGFSRSLDEAAFFAAAPGDYLAGQSRLFARVARTTALFPGAVAIGLAALALVIGAGRDRRVRMALAFGACGALLSFGPAVTPGYDALSSALPIVGAVRVSARFGYLVIVGVAVAAGFGVAALERRLPRRLATTVALVAAVAVAIEPFAGPISYTPPTPIPPIYRGVDANAIVVELPFPPPDAPYRNAPYLLHSTLNWRPLVNGYSGFVPPSYVEHYRELKDFPNDASLDALQRLGVTDLFVHVDQLDAAAARALERTAALARVEAADSIVHYRLVTTTARRPSSR